MKFHGLKLVKTLLASHLAGGGWIEISARRPPRARRPRPTSQEVGGLKYRVQRAADRRAESHLAGGGWIEIPETTLTV